MGAIGFLFAVIMCGLIVALSNWWDNRKEEKEKQRMITMNQEAAVHCKSVIPFIPQIPELENYLRGELNDFFRAHHLVGNEMEKQREQEMAISS